MDKNVNNELAATSEDRELAVFKSFYYKINAKPDSLSKAFKRNIIVNFEDLVDLNDRIKEKLSMHYQEEGYIATVTVDLKDTRVLNFKCWEEFINHNWREVSQIKAITMQWNFNIKIPGYENPQNHNLVVRLTNGLKPEEMLNLIFSGNIEDFDEVELNAFPVVARVDFIQVVLGEELINIVGNWVDGLKKNTDIKNPILMFLRKYRKRCAQYFEYVSIIMLFILALSCEMWYVNNHIANPIKELDILQINELFSCVAIGALGIYLAKKIFEIIASNIYDRLNMYGIVYIFNITRGDKKFQDDIATKDRTNGKNILLKFILSIIFNIACGIIAAIIV